MSELEQKAWDKGYACGKLDAADRIEALEAALQKIVEGHPEFLAHHLQAIARAALEQDKSVNVFDLLARYPEQDK